MLATPIDRIDMQNRRCQATSTAMTIEAAKPGRRQGVQARIRGSCRTRWCSACVKREGALRLGEMVRPHLADQRALAGHLDVVGRAREECLFRALPKRLTSGRHATPDQFLKEGIPW